MSDGRSGLGGMLVATVARLRVALGFVFGVLVLVLAQPTGRSLLAGMSVAVCGEAIRIWAAGHLHKSREVTASGPYRWCPHPLYVGSSIMGLGLAIVSASWIATALIAVYLATTLTAAIKSEEAYLRRAFGDQYDLYRSGLAAKRADAGTSRRPFSAGQAIANREYRAVVGLLVAMLLLALKASYNGAFWQAAGT
jgi:Phospholipid methyltransferase